MVRHIVMWNLKEENKEENAATIKKALEALVGQIEGMRFAQVGRCYQGYDLCLYSEFDSREAVEFYREHPLHKAAQKMVHGAIIERVSSDFEAD